MLRVPGSKDDLFKIKGAGGDVRVVYSPLDALNIARENPDREVVFLAIGFETTAPANAMAVKLAKDQGICKLFRFGLARARAPSDRSDHEFTRQSSQRLSRRRTCLLRDRLRGIPAAVQRVRNPDCGHRI